MFSEVHQDSLKTLSSRLFGRRHLPAKPGGTKRYNPVFSSLRLYHFRDEPTYMLVVISALKHKDQPNRNQMVQHEIMRMTWYKFKIPKAPLLWNPISNPATNFRGEGPPHSPHSHLWKCKGFMKSRIRRPMAATTWHHTVLKEKPCVWAESIMEWNKVTLLTSSDSSDRLYLKQTCIWPNNIQTDVKNTPRRTSHSLGVWSKLQSPTKTWTESTSLIRSDHKSRTNSTKAIDYHNVIDNHNQTPLGNRLSMVQLVLQTIFAKTSTQLNGWKSRVLPHQTQPPSKP